MIAFAIFVDRISESEIALSLDEAAQLVAEAYLSRRATRGLARDEDDGEWRSLTKKETEAIATLAATYVAAAKVREEDEDGTCVRSGHGSAEDRVPPVHGLRRVRGGRLRRGDRRRRPR